MPYRQTPRTRARLAAARERIVASAWELVAGGGWEAASVSAVAATAGVATGTVYRHVASKDELFAEVFRRAAGRELARVGEVAAGAGPAPARIEAALRVFAARALRGRRQAYALIAEPAAPAVEAERLAYRRGYRDVFAEVVAAGVAAGELDWCDAEVVAAVLTGAMAEALVGPLAPVAAAGDGDPREVVDELVGCCLRALPARKDLP